MDIKEMQRRVVENKRQHGFNTTDLYKDIILTMEEVGELCRNYRDGCEPGVVDAIGDTIIYCLGMCELVGVDAHDVLVKIITNNKTREYRNKGL